MFATLPLLTVLVPLLNFLLMVAFSNHTRSWRHLSLLIIGNMVFLLVALVSIFPAIARGESSSVTLGGWILSDLLEVNWVFAIDALTYTMLLVVLAVSTLVHLYSTEYMSEDPHTARFISYLSLFTFFMLILVTSNNFVSLFLGWEGVGLCSYLLISFWFTRIQANKAAIKAMVVNRVSDLFFTIGILAVFLTFQSVEFSIVFALASFFAADATTLIIGYEIEPLALITFLLFLGAMGKSAQIGLHTWLPDAMEGPTPVSALIHAATMVTAGVFLIIRCSSLFELARGVLKLIVIVGAATAFMAATSGLLQNDLKKVIAYSTCSQLGYMIFVCGLSGYNVSLFHLSTHAFFKALLFLSAGAIIHAVASEQDMRKFGGLAYMLPYTYAAFFVGSLALMGIPFLSGFYSKDLILEIAGGAAGVTTGFAYALGLISAFFTTFYSFRLLFLAFYGPSRTARLPLEHTHELSGRMAAALLSLALGSVFLGIFGRDLFVGPGTVFWNDSIVASATIALGQLSGEFMSTTIKLIPLFSAIISVLLVFYVYGAFSVQHTLYGTIPTGLPAYRFLTHKWGFDTVYNQFINRPLMEGAYNIIFSLFDKGSFETAGPTGLGRQTILFGRLLSSAQTGRVYDYASLMLGALCLALIGVYLFPVVDPTCFGSKKDCSSFEGYNFFLNWLEKSYHQFAVLTDLSSLSFTTLDITILLLSPIVLKRLKKVCLVEVSSKLQLPCQPSAVVTNTPSPPAISLPVLRIVSVEWSKRVHPGEVAPKLQLRTVDAPRLSATSRPLRRWSLRYRRYATLCRYIRFRRLKGVLPTGVPFKLRPAYRPRLPATSRPLRRWQKRWGLRYHRRAALHRIYFRELIGALPADVAAKGDAGFWFIVIVVCIIIEKASRSKSDLNEPKTAELLQKREADSDAAWDAGRTDRDRREDEQWRASKECAEVEALRYRKRYIDPLAEKAYKEIKADPVHGSPGTLHEIAHVTNPTLARHYDVAERVAMGRHAHPTVYNFYQQNEFGTALYKEVAAQFPGNSKVHKTLREEAIKTANNFECYKRNAELLYNNGLPITDPNTGAGDPVLVGGYTFHGQPVVTAHNNTTGESLVFVGDKEIAAVDNTVRAVLASRQKSSSVSATDTKHDAVAGSSGKMDCSSWDGDGFFEWLEGSYPQLAAVLYSLPYGASFLLQLLYITVRRLDEKGVFDPLFHRINTLRWFVVRTFRRVFRSFWK